MAGTLRGRLAGLPRVAALAWLALSLAVGGAAAQTPDVPAPGPVAGLHDAALERRVEEGVHAALLATDGDARDAHLDAAEEVARALVAAYPESADSHYWLSVVKGIRTEYSNPFKKLSTGPEVLDATVRTLELDSLHAGGHEMMGRLHAAVMRLPWPIRQLALRMGLGDALGDASWDEAERHFRVAVAQDARAHEPRLELAKLLVQRDRPAEAVPFLEELSALEVGGEVERRVRAEGDSLLAELRGDGVGP